MIEVTRLAKEREVPLAELPDAVRTYKLGVLDNPWKREHLRKRIVDGEQRVPARVVGQPQAVTKTLDILKRAVLGLSGAQAARASSRPRGVLFFAGPTGVGKTELAKAITSLVFGNEDAYLRFDMSEFSAEHAGDRLIGSPPGYVGFEAGGELTNAVRQDPFRVILFDEIEKAHPRILDKFLQILEDGRLTDGRGNTAFFSESILVFTSNLGTPARHARHAVHRCWRARSAARVTEHFTTELNRPGAAQPLRRQHRDLRLHRAGGGRPHLRPAAREHLPPGQRRAPHEAPAVGRGDGHAPRLVHERARQGRPGHRHGAGVLLHQPARARPVRPRPGRPR